VIKKYTFYLLTTLIILLTLEGGLRLLKYSFIHQQNKDNIIHHQDSKSLRILTLGESTTADNFPDNSIISWPRRLEKLLKERGINARVYNEAMPATTTHFILKKLPEQLEHYRPHLVIAMMGVNDPPNMWLKEKESRDFIDLLLNLRIAKLSRKIIEELQRKSQPKIHKSNHLGIKKRKMIIQLSKEGKIDQAFQLFETELSNKTDLEKAIFCAYISRELLPSWKGKPKDFEPSFLWALKSSDFSLFVSWIPERVAMLSNMLSFINEDYKIKGCYHLLKKIKEVNYNPSGPLLSYLASCSTEKNSLEWERFFSSFNLAVNEKRADNATQNNYLQIYNLLSKNKITLYAMQYPVMPLKKLISKLIDYTSSHIFFISNQKNFQKVIQQDGHDSLFIDLFAQSFGHTNNRGHELIAENALEALLKTKALYNIKGD